MSKWLEIYHQTMLNFTPTKNVLGVDVVCAVFELLPSVILKNEIYLYSYLVLVVSILQNQFEVNLWLNLIF